MSCQIKQTAAVLDVPLIRRYLFPTDDTRGGDSWLNQCKISACPTGELIALARESKLLLLAAKWDLNSESNQYQTLYSGTPCESDVITDVICLPIVGQSQSSHVGPDWTCIVIGFESGYVRFYTDNCVLLLQEQMHDERVVSLKCQSQHSPRPDLNSDLRVEEVYVQYPTNICILGGGTLFTTLRSCRSQLAIAQARNEAFQPLEGTLLPRKWGFQEQSVINDAVVVGMDLSNTFDHLLTASTMSGFDAKYRAMPPHNTLVLAAGSKPYLGFHYALEGGAQPVLSDVAKAVANKLKSALPGWLTGAKQQPEKQNNIVQPPEPMGCRYGLCDIRRSAQSLTLSPDNRLAAVSDSLGRVLLVDARRGVCIRMFKGYREAQCCFVQVPDERKSKHRAGNKVAMFLVIYSPKKGTIEFFALQNGNKIATFTASKFSRLLYVNYGLMGFSTATKSRFVCQFTSILLDNDGAIKEFEIPFHFALTEKSSKKVRDIHLFKRLKQVIKSAGVEPEQMASEALNTCSELKTADVKLQCIEMLMDSKDIEAETLLQCCEKLIESLENDLESGHTNLKCLLQNLKVLVDFYVFLNSPEDSNGNTEENLEKFVIPSKQLENLQRLLDLRACINVTQSTELKVSFCDNRSVTLSDFLSSFVLTTEEAVIVKTNLDDDVLLNTASRIFTKFLENKCSDFVAFKQAVNNSKIPIKDLFRLLIILWVNRPINENLEDEVQNFSRVIYSLAQITDESEIAVEYNSTSKFWSEIREMLANSTHPFPAHIAALACHTVSQRIEQERELQSSNPDDSMEIWEKLTQENCEWSVLIGKLEDVSLLNIVLSNKASVKDPLLPKLKHELEDLSLRSVLKQGRGCVSELVAKWLTNAGVSPEDVVLHEKICENSCEGVDELKIEHIKSESFFNNLTLIKTQFPYSLSSSVLLLNMSWEYVLAWHKEITELPKLEAAMSCLNSILDTHVKKGLNSLVWNTHLKLTFESCCKLLNKVGKLPKAKLCQQDTQFTDRQIKEFLRIATEFLYNFMDVMQESYNKERRKLKYEPLWENGGQPLAELALQQTTVNYELLLLHYELSLALYMMTDLEIKHTKPLYNLFNPSVLPAFFTDFSKPLKVDWRATELKVTESRLQFLFKVISASIESITVDNGTFYTTKHVQWVAKCELLATIWNMEVDELKRYQVTQLYNAGFDSLAEELLPAVSDREALGPALLKIAGKRLVQLITSSKDLGEKMATTSPALTNYLDTLNGEWCAPSSVDSIESIASHCMQCLTNDQPEHKLCSLLLYTCTSLKELQS